MNNICSPLLDEREVAEYLRLAVPTLRRWRWAGKGLPFHRIGGRIRYSRADLERFVAAGRRTSTSDSGPEDAAP